MNAFRKKSANGHLTSAYTILTDAIGGRTSVPEDKELPVPEKMRDYSWILDDHQPGIEYLRLNFPVIQKMDLGRGAGMGGNPVLASDGHWTLRVDDFRRQLKRLTPESRLELCRNDNGIKAIYYLAHNQGRLANDASIKINYALADQIDMVGDDFDSLNDYKADEVIASLQHTVLTEEKIRNIITTLPEEERFHFLHECDSRFFALEDLLVDQFWRDQLDPRQLEGNPQYKRELEAYINWLLANTYFNTVINIEPLELNDESLDPYMKKACKLLSQERLREALLNAAHRTCIKVDVNLFRVLGGNITGSAYSGLINKNCH
jgi:hypothetical protein